MTTPSESHLRLQAAVRDFVREYDEGLATDWLLLTHYIPATGAGDSYLVVGREGISPHAARGLISIGAEDIECLFDEYAVQDECGCDDHGAEDIDLDH